MFAVVSVHASATWLAPAVAVSVAGATGRASGVALNSFEAGPSMAPAIGRTWKPYWVPLVSVVSLWLRVAPVLEGTSVHEPQVPAIFCRYCHFVMPCPDAGVGLPQLSVA